MKRDKVLAQPVSGTTSKSLVEDPSLYLKAGLWNIRTLNSADNRELLSNSLFSREFDLIALAETQLTSNGSSEIEVTDLDRIQGLVNLEGDTSRSLCGTEQPVCSTARRHGRGFSTGHLTESNRNSASANRAHLNEGVSTRSLCRNEVPATSTARDTGIPGSLNCQVACETVTNSSRDNDVRNRGGWKTVDPIPPTSSNSAQDNLTLSGTGSTLRRSTRIRTTSQANGAIATPVTGEANSSPNEGILLANATSRANIPAEGITVSTATEPSPKFAVETSK